MNINILIAKLESLKSNGVEEILVSNGNNESFEISEVFGDVMGEILISECVMC